MYKVLNTRFFNELAKPQKIKFFYGGSGSGKSVALAQYYVQKLISGDGYRRAVMRKTFPSMKLTTYLVIKSILEDWNIPYEVHQTDHYFKVDKNYLYFLALDDPQKIKGMEMKEVWLEECNEFTEEDFNQLLNRLSRDKYSEDATVHLSYNPVEENHWVVKRAELAKKEPDKYVVMHSTYHDNAQNLSKSFIERLEAYIDLDENFYRVYCLGEPGVLKNRIYSHFSIEDSSKWPYKRFEDEGIHCYGCDFGWIHEMALMEIWYLDEEFYVKELFYKRENTTDDLRFWMDTNGVSKNDYVFCDNAEPDRIEMLCTASNVTSQGATRYVDRFNAWPCKKDVKAGIDYIKSKRIHLCSHAINTIKEYNNYKFKETKEGIVLEEPVKAYDNALDAMRYGIYTLNVLLGLSPNDEIANGTSFASTVVENRQVWAQMGFK